MTDDLELETQAATDEVIETSAEGQMVDETEVTEAETQEQPKPAEQPKETDPDKVRLEEEVKTLKARLNGVKADKKLAASVIKGVMADYGLTYDEAVKYAGANIAAKDLQARFEAADVADNPLEVQAQAFNNLYVNAGVKGTLDEVYGEDTQPYVAAFERALRADDALASEFASLEPTKLPAFVVKKGKEVLAKAKATETLADENARLKAEIEALKAGKSENKTETVTTRKTLPLSGAAPATGAIGQPRGSGFAERLFG